MYTVLDTVSTCVKAFFALGNSQQRAARRCKAGMESRNNDGRAGIRTCKFSNDGGTLSTTPDPIQELFEKCGIQTTEKAQHGHRRRAIVRVGFHSLRHSFVSLCTKAKTPLHVVQKIVGHATPPGVVSSSFHPGSFEGAELSSKSAALGYCNSIVKAILESPLTVISCVTPGFAPCVFG